MKRAPRAFAAAGARKRAARPIPSPIATMLAGLDVIPGSVARAVAAFSSGRTTLADLVVAIAAARAEVRA